MDLSLEMKRFKNVFGGSLSSGSKMRLQAVADNPSIATWEDAYSIILGFPNGPLTLWAAVRKVDPTYTCEGRFYDAKGNVTKDWERVPDQETLRRAFSYAAFHAGI